MRKTVTNSLFAGAAVLVALAAGYILLTRMGLKGEEADWKTYTNSSIGFELQYPFRFEAREEWKTMWDPKRDEPILSVAFNSAYREKFQIDVFSVPEGTTPANSMHWIRNKAGVSRINKFTEITVAGVAAHRIEGEQLENFNPPRPRTEVIFVKGTRSYLIHIPCGYDPELPPEAMDFCVNNHGDSIDSIIAGFKFTPR